MSMDQWIAEADQKILDGYLKIQEDGNGLRLYNYTQLCTMRGGWDEITLACRGLIIDLNTKQVVARPFRKFFNLNENDWSTLDKFPVWTQDEPVEITTKLDGSLGIIYYHPYLNKWKVATRGSFSSDQAIWAEAWMYRNWKVEKLNRTATYLTEIIYPENRIVVDYKGKEDMVLLGIIGDITNTWWEYPRSMLLEEAAKIGASVVDTHEFTNFQQIHDLRTKLDFNSEGWVLRFLKTDQRVKLKTDDYCRVHRIISNLSPLAMWESMEDGKVREDYLQAIPEEFREEVRWMQQQLEDKYSVHHFSALGNMLTIQTKTGIKNPATKEEFKSMALAIQTLENPVTRSCCFALMRGHNIDSIIKEAIRPRANILEDTNEEEK